MIARRRRVVARPELEALEGRVALSSAAHSGHAVAAAAAEPSAHVESAHVRARQVATAAGPVLVNLTPGTTGVAITKVTYDPRVHLITVRGTVDVNRQAIPSYGYVPPYPTTEYLGVNATQAVNRFQSVSGFQYPNVTIADPTVQTVPFTTRILASTGQFRSGVVNLSVTASNPYNYNYQTFSVLARMQSAKAF